MVAQGGGSTAALAAAALPPAGATATLSGPIAPAARPPPGPASPMPAAAPAAAAGLRQSLASWLSLTRTLMWRERLIITRNPADVAGRMLIFTWVAIIAGLMNYGTGAASWRRLGPALAGLAEACWPLLLLADVGVWRTVPSAMGAVLTAAAVPAFAPQAATARTSWRWWCRAPSSPSPSTSSCPTSS
jgi:hypothetical protein